MPTFENRTAYAVEELAGLDHRGVEFYALVVKATFRWTSTGHLQQTSPAPVTIEDVHAGDPATTGPLLESDLVPTKPRVDIVLAGKFSLAAPARRADVTLTVGRRLHKTVRLMGERVWVVGQTRALALSDAKPFVEMPIAWELSFGGADPNHPDVLDRRNPCGRGMRKQPQDQVGALAASFEDPRHPIVAWNDRPCPVGFGPIARHWEPRIGLAGTYDAKWQEEIFPLLPNDFNPEFYNCAPEDQRLDDYRAGEEVCLTGMTTAGHDHFKLPELSVEVTLAARRGRRESQTITPDTVIIEPAQQRVSFVSRALFHPSPDITAIDRVIVGSANAAAVKVAS